MKELVFNLGDIPDEDNPKLTSHYRGQETDTEVMKYLHSHKRTLPLEIQEKTEIPRHTARDSLWRLIKKGLVEDFWAKKESTDGRNLSWHFYRLTKKGKNVFRSTIIIENVENYYPNNVDIQNDKHIFRISTIKNITFM